MAPPPIKKAPTGPSKPPTHSTASTPSLASKNNKVSKTKVLLPTPRQRINQRIAELERSKAAKAKAAKAKASASQSAGSDTSPAESLDGIPDPTDDSTDARNSSTLIAMPTAEFLADLQKIKAYFNTDLDQALTPEYWPRQKQNPREVSPSGPKLDVESLNAEFIKKLSGLVTITTVQPNEMVAILDRLVENRVASNKRSPAFAVAEYQVTDVEAATHYIIKSKAVVLTSTSSLVNVTGSIGGPNRSKVKFDAKISKTKEMKMRADSNRRLAMSQPVEAKKKKKQV